MKKIFFMHQMCEMPRNNEMQHFSKLSWVVVAFLWFYKHFITKRQNAYKLVKCSIPWNKHCYLVSDFVVKKIHGMHMNWWNAAFHEINIVYWCDFIVFALLKISMECMQIDEIRHSLKLAWAVMFIVCLPPIYMLLQSVIPESCCTPGPDWLDPWGWGLL